MPKQIEDIMKNLPLDADVQKGLVEAFNAALEDAKVAQEATVREELSAQYSKDLGKIQEAFGVFLEDRIKPHVVELQEEVQAVDRLKEQYANKITNVKKASRAYLNSRIEAIEEMVASRLQDEMSELHEDVTANRRAAIASITESKQAMERDRILFREKAAKVLEHIVNVKVPAQLEPLREDIIAARNDNFGREIFEAFQNVFRRQFFNTSNEFKKVLEENNKLRESREMVARKAAKALAESKKEAKAVKKAYSNLNESVRRKETMNRLLKPLAGQSRLQMKTLLEATKTEKLEATYRKALPQVVRKSKSTLTEGKRKPSMEMRTGGAKNLAESYDAYDEFDDEIAQIKRRAGTR